MEKGERQEDTLPIKTSNIAVGDRIIIVFNSDNAFDRGYVRYVGEVVKGKGIYYGIELDEAKGKHAGKDLF